MDVMGEKLGDDFVDASGPMASFEQPKDCIVAHLITARGGKRNQHPPPCLISFYNLLSVESTTCLPNSFCFIIPYFSARSACVSKFVLITEETTG